MAICKNGSEPTSWTGEDEPDSNDSRMTETSSDYDTMAAKARKLADKLGITFEQAFARVYSENGALAKMDKAHHTARVSKAYGVR